MSKLLNLREKSRGVDNDGFLHHDSDFESEFPGLWELLSRCRLEGKDRETSTLGIFCEPGKVVVCINDRHTDLRAFYASESFHEALEGAEKAFQHETLDWRKNGKTKR